MCGEEVDITEAQSSRQGVVVYPVRRSIRAISEVNNEILLDSRTWDRERKHEMVAQLASLVAALHERGITHGALSPSSVIFSPLMGCLQLRNGGLYQAIQSYRPQLLLSEPSRYAPPEVLNNPTFAPSKNADVYSWACVAYAMFIGGVLFPSSSCPTEWVRTIVQNGGHTRLIKPHDMTVELWEILRSCWNTDPHWRPPMDTIVTLLRAGTDF